MPNEQDAHGGNFIVVPTASGGGAILRRDQCAGARANGSDGSIIYLECGPSVYTSATIPQLARYLEAEVVELRRE